MGYTNPKFPGPERERNADCVGAAVASMIFAGRVGDRL